MLNLYDFINNSNVYQKLKVNELIFTIYDCLAEESRLGIWSHHNLFAYVLNGKKVWKAPEKTFSVGPGDSIFIKKGAYISHQIFEGDFSALLAFVSDEFIKEIIEGHELPIPRFNKGEGSDSIIPLQVGKVLASYYESVLSYFQQSVPPPECLLRMKFQELIIITLYCHQNTPLTHCFKQLCGETKISLSNTMQTNFSFHLQLEEFARLSGRSLSTFKRDFIKLYRISPGKWLTKKRLEHGKYLLETTGKDVNEIALDSGFENTSHFIRIFKEQFGTSPLKYKCTVPTP